MESGKPKVLIFIDWYLPGYRSGGPVTSVSNMVLHLAPFFEFFIVTRNVDYQSDEPYNLPINTWTKQGQANVCYLQEGQLSEQEMRATIEEVKPHTVYVNGVYSKFFTRIPVKLSRKMGVENIIVSPRGMLSPGSLAVKRLKKQLYLKWIRATGLFNGVLFHVTTDGEKQDIERLFNEKVQVVPNLPRPLPSSKPPYKPSDDTLYIICIARVAPEKNTLLALQALQYVKEKVRFDWYGPVYNQAYLERCRSIIDQLPEQVVVTFKDAVSPDLLPKILSEYQLFFLPTTGENYGHSIVEAMMAGLPVLISKYTPWRDVKPNGAGWALENDPQRYGKAISEFCQMSDEMRNEMSTQAFNYISDRLNIEDAVQEYISMLEQ